MKSVVLCGCGQYVPLEEWKPGKDHKHELKQEVDFSRMSHKQVLEYYAKNIEQIEKGMTLLFKELPVFRGKIDLVAWDSKKNICLIEVIHKSNKDREYYTNKLMKYKDYLRKVGLAVFSMENEYRLILVRPGKPAEEIFKRT